MDNDTKPGMRDRSGPTEEELLSKASEQLRERAENIDASTSAKLDQMRTKAVASIQRPASPWFMQAVYGGALAACLVVTVVMLNFPSEKVEPELPYFETVLLNGDFEMLSEDLEFYEWLEQETVEDDV